MLSVFSPLACRARGLVLGSLVGLLPGGPLAAQQLPVAAPDTLAAAHVPPAARTLKIQRVVWQTAPALLLLGAGIATIGHHTPMSSVSTADEIGEHFATFHTHADDYIQYAPYAGLASAALLGVQTADDGFNTALIALKAEVLMGTTVTVLKRLTHVTRPDGSSPNSFPSGHTAQAFVAATVLATELHDHPWVGVGAYTAATSVGVLRMLNKRHWQSDVLAGAGIGILCTRLAYATHRYRWSKANLTVAPAWLGPKSACATLVWRL